MDKLKMHSPNLVEQNIDKLAQLFPNCITEAKDDEGKLRKVIDFDQLKQELSRNIVEGPQERYQLNWPGKREALLTANAPIAKTLRPCREDSVNFDTTKNLFIEGDNLDALKLLQETYLGKVKMIYIDPPYNTGNDFIYEDDFADDVDSYVKRTNQVDDEGNRLVANTESNGRFHSDWLSMMLSRLKLARNLLSTDGVIFVSIGVEEVENLKSLMNEVFGEQNFIEIFSWVKTSTPPALSTKSRKTNEYILCFENNKSNFQYRGEKLDGGDQPLLNTGNRVRELKFPKDKVIFNVNAFPNGNYEAQQPDRVKLIDSIKIENGKADRDFRLEGEFKWTQEFLDSELSKGTTFVIKSQKLSIRFIRQEEGFKRPTNFIPERISTPVINKPNNNVGTNETASKDLCSLMGKEVFSYPKPLSLIEFLINFAVEDGDIVMDFFAGSGTTAHAVMNWSASANKKLNFITVQLPEDLTENLKTADSNAKKVINAGLSLLKEIDKPLFLSELTKERLRRARATHAENLKVDSGFRVLKVDSSNMAEVYYSPDSVNQADLFAQIDNVKEDRTEEDLLFQVMLDWGVDLTLPIRRETIDGKTVFFVADNALVACFDKSGNITEYFVKQLAQFEPMRLVFRDAGFASDSTKINVEQVLKQLSPTTEVKSI